MIIDTFGRNALRTRAYQCPICDHKEPTRPRLREHMDAVHPRKPGLNPTERAWLASRIRRQKVTLAGKKEEP